MRHARTLILAVLCAVAPAAAQGTKAPGKADSTKATKTQAPVTKAPAPKPDAKQAAGSPGAKTDAKQAAAQPATKTDTKQANTKAALPAGSSTKAPAAAAPATPPAGTKAAPPPPAVVTTPTIMREVFAYTPEGRRDPFATLLSSNDLRPTVADLKLTGILYDENGSNSIAIMRDLSDNKQYRVTTGQTLGRMKVALIKRKVVIFSIEAFGLNRQDSLVLGDTTKVRVVK